MNFTKWRACATVAAMLMAVFFSPASLRAAEGTDQQAELAKQLANPIASLISVPLQSNWDFGIGPEHAMQYTLNVQPVIPFDLGCDWNLITRTILPIIYAEPPIHGVTTALDWEISSRASSFRPKCRPAADGSGAQGR